MPCNIWDLLQNNMGNKSFGIQLFLLGDEQKDSLSCYMNLNILLQEFQKKIKHYEVWEPV